MQKSKNLAILVYSCWKNSDMWNIFMQLFKKYWADCRYKIILLTDECKDKVDKYEFDEIVTLDSSWYAMIMEGIRVAGTEYVMLWMDDYLLCDYVNNEDVEYYIEKAQKYNAANIRLTESQMLPSQTFSKDHDFVCYKPGTAYSFTTQVGIWSAEFLKKHMKPIWSAWDFERKGSVEVTNYKQPLLAPKNYAFPYEEGVRKGKWLDSGIRVCKRNNIKLNFRKRKPMSHFELAWIYFKAGILELNPTLVVKLQNLLQHRK